MATQLVVNCFSKPDIAIISKFTHLGKLGNSRWFITALLMLLVFNLLCLPGYCLGRKVNGTIVVDGRVRHYHAYLPPGYETTRNWPAIVLIHGGGGTGRRQIMITDMLKRAQQEQFILILPEGSGILKKCLLTWNSGSCCGYARTHKIDDVKFIDKVIDIAVQDLHADSRRIFVTGESNGAMLAYLVAAKLSDKIAAVAPVAGSMNGHEPMPSHPVSVIAFNGTGDTMIRYNGGLGIAYCSRVKIYSQSVAYAMSFWKNNNGCFKLFDHERRGNVEVESYGGGREGSEVSLYSIIGGRHCWPGGQKNWILADNPTKEISATDVMMDFFTKHPKRSYSLPVPANSMVQGATQQQAN